MSENARMLCFDIQREKFQDSFWSVLLSNISAGQNAVFRPAGFTPPPEFVLPLMPVCPAATAPRTVSRMAVSQVIATAPALRGNLASHNSRSRYKTTFPGKCVVIPSSFPVPPGSLRKRLTPHYAIRFYSFPFRTGMLLHVHENVPPMGAG